MPGGDGRGEQGRKGKRRVWGRGGALLEGSTNSATLEWLGRAVVVHHAAFGLALSGEEQVAEFIHLRKGKTSKAQQLNIIIVFLSLLAEKLPKTFNNCHMNLRCQKSKFKKRDRVPGDLDPGMIAKELTLQLAL